MVSRRSNPYESPTTATSGTPHDRASQIKKLLVTTLLVSPATLIMLTIIAERSSWWSKSWGMDGLTSDHQLQLDIYSGVLFLIHLPMLLGWLRFAMQTHTDSEP